MYENPFQKRSYLWAIFQNLVIIDIQKENSDVKILLGVLDCVKYIRGFLDLIENDIVQRIDNNK